VIVGKKENKREVIEYYHRGVVAHLVGFDLPIVLDVEMIAPGEGEIAAAKRLLERLLARYSRFFDAVQGDALYWEAPLFHLCQKHGKHLLAVLKENNPSLLADAEALFAPREPDLVRQEDQRLVRYWDEEGFITDSIQKPIRVVRAEETTTKRERIAGKLIQHPQTSNWFWATSIPQALVPSRQLAQIGHERWKIENTIFNALGEHWSLDHCFHHAPTAILNFILILFIAHILVACFHRLNMKPPVRDRFTLIAIATQILLGIGAVAAKEITWLHARCNPPPQT
jgi:hypothetical protein